MFTTKSNYKVVFEHTDNGKSFKDKNWRRTTVCRIKDLQTEQVIIGIAVCNPVDNYNYNEGRKKALTEALKNGEFSREERREFWEGYFKKRGVTN